MAHDHVELAERVPTDAGHVAKELVPAEKVSRDEWLIVGTPGIVNGCAAGDRLRVDPDGTFQVLARGGNVAVHIYSSEPLAEAGLHDLRRVFGHLGGTVEWPATGRFAVITVPASVGFQSIEEPLGVFTDSRGGTEWYFGNVYDEDGSPLGWWA